jgi:hypothetical protein
VTTGRRTLVPVWLGGSCDRLLDGGEGLIAQFAEDVVGASAELARKREAGAGVVDPLGVSGKKFGSAGTGVLVFVAEPVQSGRRADVVVVPARVWAGSFACARWR